MFDVIIIGGGVSGINLLRNLRKNIKSLLITNGKIGKSNSLMAQGGIQIPQNNESSKNLMKADIAISGRGNSKKKLVDIFVNNSVHIGKELSNLGVHFKKNLDGEYLKMLAGGCAEKRVLTTDDMLGVKVIKRLVDNIIKNEKNYLEFTHVTNIELNNDYISIKAKKINGDIVSLKTKNLCLCCGGTSFYEAQNKKRKTTNIPNKNHTIRELCKKLKIKMSEPEFQLQPYGIVCPPLKNRCFPEKVSNFDIKILDKNKKIICQTNMDRLNIVKKINNTIEKKNYILSENNEKCVEMDISNITISEFEYHFPKLFKDFGNQKPSRILISPIIHYELSGILVNSKQQTNIPNIYACGEMAYGIHGKNRLMGLGILEGMVSSKICSTHLNNNIKSN